MQPLLDALAILPHAKVATIPSGCCGMAGAFGYEREHYEVSMRIGELVLFPAVRAAAPETLICRARHQLPPSDRRRHGPTGLPPGRAAVAAANLVRVSPQFHSTIQLYTRLDHDPASKRYRWMSRCHSLFQIAIAA